MKSLNVNNKIVSSKKSLKEICVEQPFLIINTSCGIGKYKFNKIGYDSNNKLIFEYLLIKDWYQRDYHIYYNVVDEIINWKYTYRPT